MLGAGMSQVAAGMTGAGVARVQKRQFDMLMAVGVVLFFLFPLTVAQMQWRWRRIQHDKGRRVDPRR